MLHSVLKCKIFKIVHLMSIMFLFCFLAESEFGRVTSKPSSMLQMFVTSLIRPFELLFYNSTTRSLYANKL